MKKYYSLGIVLITWLMSMTVTKVFAYDIAVEINDSVAIYYNYIHDGTELEVTFQNDKWYNSYSDTIVIPEEVTYMDKTLKVTSIGDWAFYSSKGLSSVTIPGSVERIGNYAFYECDSLVSVTIPNSVRYIGMVAFDSCKSLTTISIPNGITSIEFGTFRDCRSITSITIPDSVTTIGGDAFAGCSSLNTIKIGNSVTSIGNDAFLGCGNLTSVHAAIHPLSVCLVGIFHFLGEGIVLEPRQQFHIHGNTLIAILRGMHMQVVHGRDEQTVTEISDLGILSAK